MTGVAAALINVPGPHNREAAKEAATDAMLAMISVWSEMRLGGWLGGELSGRSGSSERDSTRSG